MSPTPLHDHLAARGAVHFDDRGVLVPRDFGDAAGEYRVCAYLSPPNRTEPAIATARFRIEPDPALVPALESKDGDEERFHEVLRETQQLDGRYPRLEAWIGRIDALPRG